MGPSDASGTREQGLPAGGLEGLVVGIPAARKATETASLVERWGGTPLVGPAVEEIPVGDDKTLRTATEAVLAQQPAWSVHMTGVGTRRWFEQAEAWRLLPGLLDALGAAGVIARGRKAAQALRERHLEPAWTPEGETSAEIAAWLGPRVQAGETVAVQRHGEPAAALSSALTTAGARLIEVVTYRWELPRDRGPAEHLVRALAGSEVHTLAITSAPQARHLFVLARALGLEDELRRSLVSRVFVGAVGPVAAEGLRAEGVEPDLIATRARLGWTIRCLAEARDQILAKNASR
jgi:uroporphyrinogen-III synthase